MKNINENKIKIIRGAIFAFALANISTMTSGCSPKADCDIKTKHAHVYINEDGLKIYRISEKEVIPGMFKWTEETKEATDEMKIIKDEYLFGISENREYLEQKMQENKTHIEYEYEESVRRFNGHVWHTRNITLYTPDSTEYLDYTGRAVEISYKYKGYRIITNNKGKLILEESPLVDDITLLEDSYPYFKLSDYCNAIQSEPFGIEQEKKLQMLLQN